MSKAPILAIAAGGVLASTSAADASLTTYQYNGTVSTNTFWSSIHGQSVEASFTIDTSVAASSLTDNRAQYEGAIVSGYYQFGDIRFDIDPNGARNRIILRTDVEDTNFGTVSNRLNISVSTVSVPQGPWEFPGNISLNLIDNDRPGDTISGLGLSQPLDTLQTVTDGGVDGFSVGLGMVNGVSATILSGDGVITVVPAPGAVTMCAALGLCATRRRR